VAGILTVSSATGHDIALTDALLPQSGTSINGPEVSPAVSPNGDGVNDVLTIANISKYPDNKLTVINPGGTIIFEAANYDNISKVFDGHSSTTRQMQQPGTYFYVLQYKDSGVAKTKTGFIVLKY
jgi:gliding motility-associated-like protein